MGNEWAFDQGKHYSSYSKQEIFYLSLFLVLIVPVECSISIHILNSNQILNRGLAYSITLDN